MLNRPGMITEKVSDGSFEATEAEVEAGVIDHWSWEPVGIGVSDSCEGIDVGSAGVGKSHQFCDLVEAFAGGIVDGLSEDLIISEVPDENQEGVAATDDEGDEGKMSRPELEFRWIAIEE